MVRGPSAARLGLGLRLVADASGAPVLRDQGPIGRPGTARPIQARPRTHPDPKIHGERARWQCPGEPGSDRDAVDGPVMAGQAAGSRVTLSPRASSWRTWLRL